MKIILIKKLANNNYSQIKDPLMIFSLKCHGRYPLKIKYLIKKLRLRKTLFLILTES